MVRYRADRGSPLRAFLMAFVDSLVHPASTTVIWSELPVLQKSFGGGADADRAILDKVDSGAAPVRIPPAFKFVVLMVAAVTIGSGATEIGLALLLNHPTAMQQSAFEAMDSTWKLGIGALFGLLGGKSVR
jgi:hypothetical protein